MISVVIGALLALGAVALWWHLRRERPTPGGARAGGHGRRPADYRAVEVRFQKNACDAVKRMAGKRYLGREAPEIPLPGCDAASCACRYVHHEDRREGDRRNPFPMQASLPPASAGGDRRTKKDRRRPGQTPPASKSRR